MAGNTAPRKKPAPAALAGPGSDAPFTFESSRGEVTVASLVAEPHPNPLAMMDAQERGAQAELVMLLTRTKASADGFRILKALPADELERFYTAWGAHSGVTPGESRAS